APIDLDRAVKDPRELGRALMLPHHAVASALGPHTVAVSTSNTVSEGSAPISTLDDHTTIELGDKASYHAIYANSADYGREITFVGDKLYLRPRYQRWHVRAPESAGEPEQLHDELYQAVAATWDLLEPGAELSDRGTAQVAGRSGRKIEVKLSPNPRH